MPMRKESVHFCSLGDDIVGLLMTPEADGPAPVLIVCPGAGEPKENYVEMGEYLAGRGIATLALDMHGHGESGGERFYVDMRQWVPDIKAAIDLVTNDPRIDGGRIAAFGLSSGGTAILEAALEEPRLKALVALDATVRNSMPAIMSWPVKLLLAVGNLKLRLTGSTLRVPLAKISIGPKVASDPQINDRIMSDPRALAAFMAFPLPGAEQAFFVDTIQRVGRIRAATMVIWGEDDKLDPPETGRLLFEALTCKKQLHVVAGNGHVGHLDRNRAQVFELTASWILENVGLGIESVGQTLFNPCAQRH